MSGSSKPTKRWQWRAEWLLQTSLENLLAWLPGGIVYRLGLLMGGLAWHVLPTRRAIVLRNLRIAFAGEKDAAEIRRIACESFRRTGANLFSAAHSARLPAGRLQRILHVDNPALMAEAGGGVAGPVLLLAHMSNWELLARMVHFFPAGTRAGAFYRPLNNPLLDQRALLRREADGTRMFSKGDNPHQAVSFLRDRGCIGVLSDQRTGLAGEVTEFFGRLTRCSPLPGLLARRAKVRVAALALFTTAPGRWTARYLPVGEGRATADCMAALEQTMRCAPEEVFWFQDRWRVYLQTGSTITEWLGGPDRRGSKPHRALLWLVGAPGHWRPAAGWLHPDVRYEAVLAPGQPLPDWLPPDTPAHTADPAARRDEVRRILARIDAAASLPVDFILAASANSPLRKAARRSSIPLAEGGG
jgi:KDO2-lipid IV(A) lauroyltransferase